MAMQLPWQRDDRKVPRQRDDDEARRAEAAEAYVRELERRADEAQRKARHDVWTKAIKRVIEGG